MIRLTELHPGDRISGVTGEPVEVIKTEWTTDDAITLIYRSARGEISEVVLFEEQEVDLDRVTVEGRPHEVDVRTWKVAAEALRLKHAALVDPMLAVSSSTLQPLPHQITAVYGEFLPRRPLRYLLADDPGAGKTIMCGLYVKELMLRGDLSRCLIVAPGGLVDQWSNELHDKFGLVFTTLTRELVSTCVTGSVFAEHPLLIARMDVLANDEELQQQIERSEWDLVVVDEAHRMSATGTRADSKKTNRYQLGMLLAESARNFLLMTATPHSGDPERFQAFLALLDRDRFGSHRVQERARPGTDLMRRMLKEDLLTMEGTPLFTERRAQTVSYELSPLETRLYDEVSEYVRVQMNRAEALLSGQARTVGFALMVLQRRLASSPESILRSLQRRRERLRARRKELASGTVPGPAVPTLDGGVDDTDVAASEEREHSPILDAATTALTLVELDAEIASLGLLVDLAAQVRSSEADQKWLQLKSILNSGHAIRSDGSRRKFIIFTEHRDTLTYLSTRIGELPRPGRVLEIHGGLDRRSRLRVQEEFVTNPEADILLATDAAGEGLNLQIASLMVNYDLPWNPTRLEQRFGRIHRIGQTEVCYLWNLVAAQTREGDVYLRLLSKMEEQSASLQGKVYDVLGEAFGDIPLEGLLKEAIRHGNDPQVLARLTQVVDKKVAKDIPDLLRRRAHHSDVLRQVDLAAARRRAENGRRHALQPRYTAPWFLAAMDIMGGRVRASGAGLHDIRFVPALVKEAARQTGHPLVSAYRDVSLGRHESEGTSATAVIGPGDRLFDATATAVGRHCEVELRELAVLVDPWTRATEPRVLAIASSEVVDGSEVPLSLARTFDFVELGATGPRNVGPVYLDYRAPDAQELESIGEIMASVGGPSAVLERAKGWALQRTREFRAEVSESHNTAMARRRQEVEESLTQEAAHWDGVASGRSSPVVSPETAQRRAADVRDRLIARRSQFEAESRVTLRPPQIHAVALVVPALLLGAVGSPSTQPIESILAQLERRGIAAEMDTEHNRLLHVDPPNGRRQWWLAVDEPEADVVSLRRTDVASALNLEDAFGVLMLARTGQVRVARPRFVHSRYDDLHQHEFIWSWSTLWRSGEEPS